MRNFENILDLSTTEIELIGENEIFVLVEGFSKYAISNYGRCLSMKRKKPCIMAPRIDKNGYTHYMLCDDHGQIAQLLAHRLVALHFIQNDDPEHKNEVHHSKKGEFPKNNYYKNLIWTNREDHRSLV